MKAPLTSTPPQGEPFMIESRVPVGPSRVETHVFVPFLQAIITMALIALDVLLWQWRPIAGAVGAVGLLMWGWRLLLGDRLLWKLETLTGHELTGDNVIGKPGPVGLLNPGAARRDVTTQAALVSDVPRMNEFVARCFYEGPSEQAQRIRPNTADRTNYVECRDALLGLGLARWRNETNHSAGWEMILDIEKTLDVVAQHVR
jgi:hypothetical protein